MTHASGRIEATVEARGDMRMSAKDTVGSKPLRLADVEVFIWVLRAGSVNGAARSLNLQASQASKAVRRLERYVDAALLERKARGVELTADGRRFAPALLEIFQRAAQLRKAAAEPELVMAAPSFLWKLMASEVAHLLPEKLIHAVETSSLTLSALAGQA